ncbi:LD-carboxypeptidase [Clostridium carnis]
MLKVNPINKQSTIGIVSPASCDDELFINKKICEFEELEFKVKKGKHIYDIYGYLAGNDKNRAEDLTAMFLDDEVDAIVCFRGGYGAIRMIPYLDLKAIKKHPKPFCGYSDITLLLNYLNKKCNIPTFHGPMINSNFKDNITNKYFFDSLSNNNKFSYNLREICGENYTIHNKRDFRGRLIGGNLSIICSSIGTPYEIDCRNSILFIEEVDESPYSVDRLLSQLISSGKLKYCNGIILGYFTDCSSNNPRSFKVEEIFNELLSPLNIPIIYGFPAGHAYPNITFPIGSKFKFSSNNDTLSICENIFKY